MRLSFQARVDELIATLDRALVDGSSTEAEYGEACEYVAEFFTIAADAANTSTKE